MRLLPWLALFGAFHLALGLKAAERPAVASKPYGLVIHGGAGSITRESLTPTQEAEYRAKLTEARDAGYAVLKAGGASLDAVVAVVTILEDSPLFNAGKGAVFTADGNCELDASIMDGRTQAAGAVAGVRRIKNPVTLARAVMEKSNHVLLTGDGAERFAEREGFALVENTYFHTPVRREEFERAKQKEAKSERLGSKIGSLEDKMGVRTAADSTSTRSSANEPSKLPDKFGTVGCVALDQQGNLAAATSTGGMAYKRFGRVGDSPIIGAGTYANNATCAVSATGWGEYFIRVSVARDIAAQLEYRGATIAEAAQATLEKVARLGGNGGVVCIDKDGNIALPFDTPGMYRGYRLSNGRADIQLFADKK